MLHNKIEQNLSLSQLFRQRYKTKFLQEMRTVFISEWKAAFPIACPSLLNTYASYAVPALKQFALSN